jgi:SAM-dependent methyltransferase
MDAVPEMTRPDRTMPGIGESTTMSSGPTRPVEDLDSFSRDYLARMYAGSTARYEERLKAIGFVGRKRVLDAGCGFGQWSLALAGLNEEVWAVDTNRKRLRIARAKAEETDRDNIAFANASIGRLPFGDGSFEAVFCYSVIYNTDYRRALAEFFRVLRSGGTLYVGTNGIGWYLYNLIRSHHPSSNFNPRAYALQTLLETARAALSGKRRVDRAVVMSPAGMVRCMKRLGFDRIRVGGDGSLVVDPSASPKRFFPATYLGLPNVFEILAAKP